MEMKLDDCQGVAFRNLVSVRLRILPYEAKTSGAPRRSAPLYRPTFIGGAT